MKYIDGFRNPGAATALRNDIAALAAKLPQSDSTTHIMEVCGSHTMAIARYGIRDLLPERVNLISGPGCPVCVTDTGYIDAAIELARTHPQAVVAALHPGTVRTRLTEGRRPAKGTLAPDDSAARLLAILDGLTPQDSGGFRDWRGEPVPW